VLDPVGSTSWHNRHISVFRELNEILLREGPPRPVVMIIGPGGVTTLTQGLLNDSAASAGPLRKLVGDLARYSDQVLRRVPMLPLVSLEPLELHRALTMPHELVVVDRSARVLRGVERAVPEARCHCADIEISTVPETADAVVAFNVICRLENPGAGMEHLAQAVRPGGWLLMDDRSAQEYLGLHPQFSRVGWKIHRRAAG
jgi:SAM-dependent methyltransferase